MIERRGLAVLFLVITMMAACIGAIAFGTFYLAAINAHKGGLREAVRLQSDLVRQDPSFLAVELTSRPIERINRIYRLIGADGSLAIGRRDGETVVYIDNPWLPDIRPPKLAPIASPREEPMRRALAGEDGTVVTRDERGRPVLAAFAPVQGSDLGVVARLPVSAFRRPIIESAAIVGGIAAALLAAGSLSFFVVGNRKLHRIDNGEGRDKGLFESLRAGIAIYRRANRKRAEAALKESEWRSVVEANTQAVVIVDQQRDIRFVNKAGEVLFGRTAEELIGSRFTFPLVTGDVTEIQITRPERSNAFGEMRSVPMRWDGQDNVLIFIQDISAHKRAEGDLRKLFQAIEQSPASVMITDVNGRIEYVNPKFCEMTGYTYPEVVGKTPKFLQSGHSPPRDYKDLWETISAGTVWRGEFLNRRKSGELFWELASIAPIRDVHGKVTHYVAVKEDISDRKATEERLRHAQRMETVGQLTGGIAHDFNNLLAIILGNLQLLEEKSATDAESRELIADAIWSAERGAQLIHQLLAFARRQRLHPKLTDVNQVVREMAGLLRRTMGERIDIREDLTPEICQTMIDRGQLESTLLNLVVNARDAIPDGGLLTISTNTAVLPRDLDGPIEEMAAGEYVVLAVADTGAGMPPEVVARVFEPFFTTKRFGEGSGLGLSMAYGFVRQSGGHITVESTVGAGSVFRLYIPRAAAASHANQAHVELRPAGNPPGHEMILVVEDDGRVRKNASDILREHGYAVFEANNASQALRALDTLPRLDLLFIDLALPNGINGSELAHRALCRRPKMRILLSGFAQQFPVPEGPLGPGIDLLPKPYRHSELTARIREMLDQPPT